MPSADPAIFASIRIGSGPVLAVTSASGREDRTGPDGAGGPSLIRRTRTVRCRIEVADLAQREPVRAQVMGLAGWGVRVELVERGVTTVYDPASAIRGYPRVSIQDDADASVGLSLAFEVSIETSEPASTGPSPVEHDSEVSTTIASNGAVTTRRSGRVRMASGLAAGWVETNVIAPGRADAQLDGRPYTSTVTVGNDPATARYEVTDQTPEFGGFGSQVTLAGSEDVVTASANGPIRRRVNGFAEGPGAAAYALAQGLPGPADIIVGRTISAPQVPSGRVTYAFEMQRGVNPPSPFGSGVLIYGFEESIGIVPSLGEVVETNFRSPLRPVLLFRSRQRSVRYRQATTAVFTGVYEEALAGMTALLDEGHLVGPSRLDRAELGRNLRRLTVTREYVFETEVDPAPVPRFFDFIGA